LSDRWNRESQSPTHYVLTQRTDAARGAFQHAVSRRLPLAVRAHAYHIFNDKTDNCVKVVLTP
jgi:threonine dehydrogenase-like Zn-dependent dehydrogenase